MHFASETSGLLSQVASLIPQWAGYIIAVLSASAVGVITQSGTLQGRDFFRTDLIAATADTSATIAHGLGAVKAAAGSVFGGLAPLVQILTPLHVDFYLSEWVVTSINTTSVVVTKRTVSLSGGAARQCRLIVMRPHSIGR